MTNAGNSEKRGVIVKTNRNYPVRVFWRPIVLMLVMMVIGSGWHPSRARTSQTRELRVVSNSVGAGQNVNVSIELIAQGNENALGFSLNFDTAIFSNPTASLGTGATGATLNVNTLQSANGRIGIAMALPSGQTFAAGTRQVVVVTFAVAANAVAGQSSLTFGDLPIARETSDPNANVLMTTYTAGAITIIPANPTPELTGLNPASVTAGSGTITLTLNGAGFVPLSSVRWNNAPRSATFINDSQVTANIPASDLVLAGIANLTVVNPSPGGGTSNGLSFTINNPAPTLNGISPNSATAGGNGFTLTVNGSNFVNGSSVQWGGSPRATTFVSSTQLTAAIQATDIASAASVSVTVANPAPGGGVSSGQTFTISQAQNPLPTITTLDPASATAGGTAFTLTINGTNFINSSTVWWNGNARPATFVSSAQLTATISASDIASAGTAVVTVNNPSPGGGSSNPATFTINPATPAPKITSLSPNFALAGGQAFTLTVNGSDFVNSSVVQWNGNPRVTAFVSANRLTAEIPATDIVAASSAMISVITPTPGGGSSTALPFAIISPVASVSAASFLGGDLAPESIVAAFGVNLATGIEIGDTVPLPTMLAGTKVTVKDSAGSERLSPLFFVAPNQINYLIPAGTVNGVATVTVTGGDGGVSIGTPQIANVSPGLFTANANGVGVPAATVFRLKSNGESITEPIAQFDSTLGRYVPIPIDLGPEVEQVFVVLFGTGFRFNGGLSGVSAQIGGVNSEVLYAGLQGDFVGLDQCNVRIPRSLAGRGEVDLTLTINGKIANTVRINIK